MFSRVQFRNLRAFDDVGVTLDLQQITTLVGPNGSGKTSVFELMKATVNWLTTISDDTSFASQLSRWAHRSEGSGTPSVEANIDGPDVDSLKVRVGLNAAGSLVSNAVVGARSVDVGRGRRETIIPWRPHSKIEQVVLNPAELRRPTGIGSALDANGGGLLSEIARLKLEDDSRFQLLVGLIRRVLPDVEDVRPRHKGSNYTLEIKPRGAAWIPVDFVSDGTVFCIGLLTYLVVRPATGVVVLDEFASSLHPQAQCEVAKYIVDIAAEQPNVQFLIATHSPYVLDELPASGVIVLTPDSAGRTRAKRLVEFAEYTEYEGILSGGEIWSSIGGASR